jgi:hypothetical protein
MGRQQHGQCPGRAKPVLQIKGAFSRFDAAFDEAAKVQIRSAVGFGRVDVDRASAGNADGALVLA